MVGGRADDCATTASCRTRELRHRPASVTRVGRDRRARCLGRCRRASRRTRSRAAWPGSPSGSRARPSARRRGRSRRRERDARMLDITPSRVSRLRGGDPSVGLVTLRAPSSCLVDSPRSRGARGRGAPCSALQPGGRRGSPAARGRPAASAGATSRGCRGSRTSSPTRTRAASPGREALEREPHQVVVRRDEPPASEPARGRDRADTMPNDAVRARRRSPSRAARRASTGRCPRSP